VIDPEVMIDAAPEVYCELPLLYDVSFRILQLGELGIRAKVRCGGATTPRAPDLAGFVSACRRLGVPFKATAGLHHPVHTGDEHGFLNLLFAAVSCATWPQRPEQIERVLEERNPRAFTIERDSIRWHDASISIADCAEARAHLLRSVGSCSFEEPVADLRRLGWWPDG